MCHSICIETHAFTLGSTKKNFFSKHKYFNLHHESPLKMTKSEDPLAYTKNSKWTGSINIIIEGGLRTNTVKLFLTHLTAQITWNTKYN